MYCLHNNIKQVSRNNNAIKYCINTNVHTVDGITYDLKKDFEHISTYYIQLFELIKMGFKITEEEIINIIGDKPLLNYLSIRDGTTKIKLWKILVLKSDFDGMFVDYDESYLTSSIECHVTDLDQNEPECNCDYCPSKSYNCYPDEESISYGLGTYECRHIILEELILC
jgi:hypothetical protein